MSNLYCTPDELDLLYDRRITSQLSNDAESTAEDPGTLQLHLDIAASRLDSYLAGRVTLPMSSPPALFKKFVAAWSLRTLFQRRGDMPKEVAADAKEGDDWIDLFLRGVVSIPSVPRQQPELSSSGATDGTSRFDNIPGFSPNSRSTSTSKGGNWSGQL